MKLPLLYTAMALCLISCKEQTKILNSGNDTVATTDTTTPKPLDSIQMRDAWIKYATPGEQHKMLSDEAGTWDVEMTFFTEDVKEQKGTAVADIQMVLGGRYQQSTYKGTMDNMLFEGISTVAFNNTTGEFTSTWADNLSTGLMVLTGPYDEINKTITFKGTMADPYDGKKITVRQVYTFVNENSRKMELFDTKNGKERKSLEMVMTRV